MLRKYINKRQDVDLSRRKNIYLTCYSYSCDDLILQETKLLLNNSANISRNTLYSSVKEFQVCWNGQKWKVLTTLNASKWNASEFFFLQPKFHSDIHESFECMGFYSCVIDDLPWTFLPLFILELGSVWTWVHMKTGSCDTEYS